MNAFGKGLLIAAGALTLAGGVTTMTASEASAAVVCNRDGDCWKVRGRPAYKPESACASTVMTGAGAAARTIAGARWVVDTATTAMASGSPSARSSIV